MKNRKAFTKSDLRSGDIVITRNGDKYQILLNAADDVDILVDVINDYANDTFPSFNYLSLYKEDLRALEDEDAKFDIMQVYRVPYHGYRFPTVKLQDSDLVFDRDKRNNYIVLNDRYQNIFRGEDSTSKSSNSEEAILVIQTEHSIRHLFVKNDDSITHTSFLVDSHYSFVNKKNILDLVLQSTYTNVYYEFTSAEAKSIFSALRILSPFSFDNSVFFIDSKTEHTNEEEF